MPILRIDHPVPNFDAWKKAFSDDPVGRKQSGVRRHRIFRSIDDENHVWIDLELDTQEEAAALHDRLQALWRRVESEGLIGTPTATIVEQIEDQEYGS